MKQTVKERIIEFIKWKGLSARAFSRLIGMPESFVSSMRNSTSDENLTKIFEQFPELSRSWLLSGEGSMIASTVSDVRIDESIVPLVPVTALANPLGEFLGKGVRREDCQYVLSAVPGAELAIMISGDSMEPKFHDGSIVYLKQINDAAFIPWGNTLVIDTENGAFIKNVFPADDLSIEARSINPMYPPMIIPKSSIFGMYRVLSLTKFFPTM